MQIKYRSGGEVVEVEGGLFIGRQDADGVDIYTGDIVEFDVGPKDGQKTKSRSVVEVRIVDGDMRSSPRIDASTKIIGNLDENPELLKG